MGFCNSYSRALRKNKLLSKNHDEIVLGWKKETEDIMLVKNAVNDIVNNVVLELGIENENVSLKNQDPKCPEYQVRILN